MLIKTYCHRSWTTPVRFVQTILKIHIYACAMPRTPLWYYVDVWVLLGPVVSISCIPVLCQTCFHAAEIWFGGPFNKACECWWLFVHLLLKRNVLQSYSHILVTGLSVERRYHGQNTEEHAKRYKRIMLRCMICVHLHFNIMLSIFFVSEISYYEKFMWKFWLRCLYHFSLTLVSTIFYIFYPLFM